MADHVPAVAPELSEGGRALWDSIAEVHDLDGPQLVQLTEACRQKDRLDELDRIIQGKGVLDLMRFRVGDSFESDGEKKVTVTVKFDAVIDRANATANAMKQLLAALRLPDEATGKKPQRRGPRGSVKPQQPGGATVSSIERAKSRQGA